MPRSTTSTASRAWSVRLTSPPKRCGAGRLTIPPAPWPTRKCSTAGETARPAARRGQVTEHHVGDLVGRADVEVVHVVEPAAGPGRRG